MLGVPLKGDTPIFEFFPTSVLTGPVISNRKCLDPQPTPEKQRGFTHPSVWGNIIKENFEGPDGHCTGNKNPKVGIWRLQAALLVLGMQLGLHI